MNAKMQTKVNEIMNLLGDNDISRKLVERELEKILPLFPTGDEQYLVVSVNYDGSNEHLSTRMEGFDGFISFLHNFQLDDDDFYEEFSFVAIKDDKEVYGYDSDYEDLEDLKDEEDEEEED